MSDLVKFHVIDSPQMIGGFFIKNSGAAEFAQPPSYLFVRDKYDKGFS